MARRVLLVEDDVLLARPLKRLLGREGYDVTHVATCAEAREVGAQFDLAVLDMELPDGVGLDLHDDLLRLGIVPCAVFFSGARTPLLQEAARVARCVEKSEGIHTLIQAMAETLAECALPVAAGCSEMAPAPPASGIPPSGRKGR